MSHIGTGEGGVVGLSEVDYRRQLANPQAIADMLCDYFGIGHCKVVVQSSLSRRGGGSFRGHYNYLKQEVAISHPYTGLLVHEVAHHIADSKYVSCKHDYRFQKILSLCHDITPRS